MTIETALIIGYLYITLFAALLISWVSYKMSDNVKLINIIEKTNISNLSKGSEGWFRSQWQVLILGIIERSLYLTSIIILKPEFIAVWLTIKTVYLSLSEKNTANRRIYNNFLIGNGLSILFAFGAAGFIQWETGSIVLNEKLILFSKNPCLGLVSLVTPAALSIFFIVILIIVREELDK